MDLILYFLLVYLSAGIIPKRSYSSLIILVQWGFYLEYNIIFNNLYYIGMMKQPIQN